MARRKGSPCKGRGVGRSLTAAVLTVVGGSLRFRVAGVSSYKGGVMRRVVWSLVLIGLAGCFVPAKAEDYSLQYEEIWNTDEAELIVRYGDVDNLGYGWPEGFDPFSGEATPPHAYPWEVDPGDAEGTDRIMVASSYVGTPPHGNDGYTGSTSRPENDPRVIVIGFALPANRITSAVLQIFVDDFQSPVLLSSFEVIMNGMRIPELADMLNALDQSGPIGQLITLPLPDRVVASMQTGELRILVDDRETGAGDGFAFDFFRLLINPR